MELTINNVRGEKEGVPYKIRFVITPLQEAFSCNCLSVCIRFDVNKKGLKDKSCIKYFNGQKEFKTMMINSLKEIQEEYSIELLKEVKQKQVA